MRSGTVPAPLAVGFGAAAAVAQREMAADTAHIGRLAHRLYDGITSRLDGVVLNGPGDLDGAQRYVGNLNLSFAYVEGESLLMGLKVVPCPSRRPAARPHLAVLLAWSWLRSTSRWCFPLEVALCQWMMPSSLCRERCTLKGEADGL